MFYNKTDMNGSYKKAITISRTFQYDNIDVKTSMQKRLDDWCMTIIVYYNASI